MKQIVLYALTLSLLAFALQFAAYRFIILTHSFEIYAGILAILFTGLGIYAGKKLTAPKKIFIEKQVPVLSHSFTINNAAIENLNISKREYEILELMANGLSNQEIAEKIFVSINTVKTHTGNLFAKLNVKRRTQAVMKAKEMGLIG